MVWWDPLTDPDYIARNGGRNRVWVRGQYLPQQWGHESCYKNKSVPYTNSAKRCVKACALDPETGHCLRNIYNFSDQIINNLAPGGRWEDVQSGWETKGATWWRRPGVWKSEDGTPYVYSTFMRTLPVIDVGPLVGMKVVVPVYISFYGWNEAIESHEATIVVTFLHDGAASEVIGTNADVSLLKPECQRASSGGVVGRHPCIQTIADLPGTLVDAALVLRQAPEDSFIKRGITGGEHWLRRHVIFRPREGTDQLPTIHLLWIRDTQTAQAQVERSLLFFVFFVVTVFVFDSLILCIEVVKISNPLEKVAGALGHVGDMELDECEKALKTVRTGFMIAEVRSLVESASRAVNFLRMYKQFLPQGCMPHTADDTASHREHESTSAGLVWGGPGHPKLMESVVSCGLDSVSMSPRTVGPVDSPASLSSSGRPSMDQRKTATALRLFAELEVKRVTVVVVNIRKFHARGVNGHRRMLSLAQRKLQELRGVTDVMTGDRLRCSWNATRAAVRHRENAVTFADCIRSIGTADKGINPLVSMSGWRSEGIVSPAVKSNALRTPESEAHASPPTVPAKLHLSIAIASGDAHCGTSGCEGLRYFLLMSPMVSFAYAAERLANHVAQPGTSVCAVETSVFEDARHSFSFRWLTHLAYRKLDQTVNMWELMSAHNPDPNTEWMYCLEAASGADQWLDYNQAIRMCLLGDTQSALRIVQGSIEQLQKEQQNEPAAAAGAEKDVCSLDSPQSCGLIPWHFGTLAGLHQLQRRIRNAGTDADLLPTAPRKFDDMMLSPMPGGC
eukprot:TRINITY_DN13120_c0_g1_i2.p1 TRINITY_DN13120_c0_g1~~TRINITY_DN13120_c0_g1_i2.p1  ORF type:complete len:790 (+),score=215.06 TRINITY_DN13120_c0_g1_i2:523-2892(+)